LGQTNIHVPSREEEEDAETNQMMRWNHSYNY
jgi:hypothetical protein